MFGFFKMYNRNAKTKVMEEDMKAVIKQTEDGRYGIVSGGQVIQTYSRKGDAVRGVNRRGLTLIEA